MAKSGDELLIYHGSGLQQKNLLVKLTNLSARYKKTARTRFAFKPLRQNCNKSFSFDLLHSALFERQTIKKLDKLHTPKNESTIFKTRAAF
ncbi:hypothetical protein [Candidatus Enterococcus myersii]|uniref:hypothetical protein n=1 Tax=Candidatus Enterococcus myersii TaxID=2815322 RepID=UPI001A8D5B0D|nr:hypothetical protein [Enterococcus sp. MJM12]